MENAEDKEELPAHKQNTGHLKKPQPIINQREGPIVFSHPAEEAFARLLDFYGIPWQYEPVTFPLEWDEEGNVITAFTPDFYLVEDDLYIELTTMRQQLVTRKNRKLRLLRELYPEVKCKLIYRRDVEHLSAKYKLFEEGPLPPLQPCDEAELTEEGNDNNNAE
ncbi:MAG: hypothetical protein N2508_09285 [Anaerolineae bacterium]|nr:hypothetical protein [Anaerolineae bacterium]